MIVYPTKFYDAINDGSLRSARRVVPWVMKTEGPQTVLDIGCGEGAWLSVFAEHGAKVVGVDGDYVNRDRLLIDPDQFFVQDLTTMMPLDAEFDLVVSLEVAEHLPGHQADRFVELLTRHSATILFSAAIPGQSGMNHINCQWPSYWIELFAKRNYQCKDEIRWAFWGDPEVEPWYKQNMMIFEKNGTPNFKGDVVHPEIYRWHYKGTS